MREIQSGTELLRYKRRWTHKYGIFIDLAFAVIFSYIGYMYLGRKDLLLAFFSFLMTAAMMAAAFRCMISDLVLFKDGIQMPISLARWLAGRPMYLEYRDIDRIESRKSGQDFVMAGMVVVDRQGRRYPIPSMFVLDEVLKILRENFGERWKEVTKNQYSPEFWKRRIKYMRHTDRKMGLISIGLTIIIFTILTIILTPLIYGPGTDPSDPVMLPLYNIQFALYGVQAYVMFMISRRKDARQAVVRLVEEDRADEIPPEADTAYVENRDDVSGQKKMPKKKPWTVKLWEPVRCPKCGKAFQAEYHVYRQLLKAELSCPFCWAQFELQVGEKRLREVVKWSWWDGELPKLLETGPVPPGYGKVKQVDRGVSTFSKTELESLLGVRQTGIFEGATFGVIAFALFYSIWPMFTFDFRMGSEMPSIESMMVPLVFSIVLFMGVLMALVSHGRHKFLLEQKLDAYEDENGFRIRKNDKEEAWERKEFQPDMLLERIPMTAKEAERELSVRGRLKASGKAEISVTGERLVCVFLHEGELTVHGDAGDGFAVLNRGANISLDGNAGAHAARNMLSGTVVVRGNTGDFAGARMVGGQLVIGGHTGKGLGDWMVGGEIFTRRSGLQTGKHTKTMPLASVEQKMLEDLSLNSREYIKIVPSKDRVPEVIRRKMPFGGERHG